MLITPTNKALLDRANQVLLKLARQDAKDKGKPDPVKTSDHRGVAVHALGGESGPPLGSSRASWQFSNSVKNLEQMIDRSLTLREERQTGGFRKEVVRHSRNGRNGRPSSRSKIQTRSPGRRLIWIEYGKSIPRGTARPIRRITA